MQLKPDVEAIFEFIGSRKDKLYEGYRPAHLIHENYLTSGVHSYYNLGVDTDKELKGTITFISPEAYPACLWIGKQITMYEGKTVVGHATITNIFNSILCENKKEYLEQLKKENQQKQMQKKIESNALLSECIIALGTGGKLLVQEEKNTVYQVFKEKVPFNSYGVDWKQLKLFYRINQIEDIYGKSKGKEFYIIWCNKLPIIKSDIVTIISNIDDVCAVEFDTWLFSVDYDEVIEFHHEGSITIGTVDMENK